MKKEPTDKEKRRALLWDGLAAIIFLVGIFFYEYWQAIN